MFSPFSDTNAKDSKSSYHGPPRFVREDDLLVSLNSTYNVQSIVRSFSRKLNTRRVCIIHDSATTTLPDNDLTVLFKAVGNLPHIETLQLRYHTNVSIHYEALAEAIQKARRLVNLDLTCINVDGTHVNNNNNNNNGFDNFIQSLRTHMFLKEFKLYFSQLSSPESSSLDSITKALAAIPTIEKILIHVKPHRTGLSSVSNCASIDHLCQNPSLKILKLAGITLREEQVRLITTALENNRILKELRLWNCGINANCAIEFSKMLKVNTTLEHFDLSRNKIDDLGCLAIAEALKNNNVTLQGLYIHHDGLTMKSYEALEQMLECNFTLKTLWAFIKDRRISETVQFYLKLNEVGKRHMLQRVNASKHEWIETLAAHRNDVSSIFYYLYNNPCAL